MTDSTPTLKARLRTDLTASMKARDALTTGTLRMALAAVGVAEVAGDTARELSDAEVLAVLGKEVRKRKEAADAFAGAGRAELADKERAESAVLTAYLPAQLDDEELAGWVAEAVEQVAQDTGAPVTPRQMGVVVKAVQARAAGRAEGGRIAAAVRAALA
ncbi:GatB/YqeY domain-containing protein [Nakamurella flavida]|uniref:GatB/YqeY domain-containing protein n=1 Tax=Nakamurella flavida TaxID=363630 RepID=A0A939C6K2_9ACTN|nr:GatB/YqeY domain-containing protein [Nakamurella flavida]MBM9477272.1 GatB/YqeY domain-containing protein [Nakamurella flavida]MDP9779728.1 uncharacterized protein YqeY [Nakamurella flavida]